jgi:hypothetical protein
MVHINDARRRTEDKIDYVLARPSSAALRKLNNAGLDLLKALNEAGERNA